MKKIILIIISVILFVSYNQNKDTTLFVEGVSDPVINLNGIWKINTNPPSEFWLNDKLNGNWKEIKVPGEIAMQGFSIKHDIPFVYKKKFKIPADYKGKQIGIEFEGVYSYTRVWVNENYVCVHSGGFTKWTCDITPFVEPGKMAMLTVEVTDKADEISYASGYARHQIGGILRNVNLVALPNNYPVDITITTDFDENFEHASLMVSGETKNILETSKIKIELFDTEDNNIQLENSFFELNKEKDFRIRNHIEHPQKWDAEHPNLYLLKISYLENDQLIWQKGYNVGFREITLKGNNLFVNGMEVKLRGACRHDIHPLLGRVSTPEYELKDVILAKEANMNFIRTSHYPPTENFLKLCDEYGIYIEDETAVCFVGTHRTKEYYPGASESNPDYTVRYLSQLEEMVCNHKNHPSVILWSIGNENSFGTNFIKSYDWVKEYDNTRPVIFSYPGNVPGTIKAYDILSMHYPGIRGNMNQKGKVTKEFGFLLMPVIFDEWAHVACYNKFTVIEDPNIRDFWGRSLDYMWRKTFDAEGGLGGAIWGMIDETFMLPDSLPGFNQWWGKIDEHVIPAAYSGNTIGYGEWGIIDTWRRKKPEFWNTKKAYSPVKLLVKDIETYIEGKTINLPLYNRFDHTNTNEIKIKLLYNGSEEELTAPDIAPHTKGTLAMPMTGWKQGEKVFVEFRDVNDLLIDKYELSIKSDKSIEENANGLENILVKEDDDFLILVCDGQTEIVFDKGTGLINSVQQESVNYSISGPHLNLRTKGVPVVRSYHKINDYGKDWKLKTFSYKDEDEQVSVSITGKYNNLIPTEYEIIISPNGEIRLKYQIQNIPQENIREIGIKFELDNVYDAFSWERNGYWSFYPDNHISASKGTSSLYSKTQKKYRIEPQKDWNKDTKSFYYEGIEDEMSFQLTNIVKSTKENIKKYSLLKNDREMITIVGNGDVSTRLNMVKERLYMYANNLIDYVDLGWGNYQKNIVLDNEYSNEVVLKINTHSNNK